MIIYFTNTKAYVNTEHVEYIYQGLSGIGPNGPDNHYVVFKFAASEYKLAFWEKENYDAFKKRKRYIEIDG